MSAITTHVLDTSLGKPAAGVRITLTRLGAKLGSGITDADGRLRTLLPDGARPEAGLHELTFEVGDYFARHDVVTFFPTVTIAFSITVPADHHHVPLLLSPFGYSTYRGS